MLEQAGTMFDNMEAMMYRLKKKAYKEDRRRSQMDINLFMIYFVFPAILLTQSEYAGLLADAVRDEWRGRFRESAQLNYTTYEEIYSTFQEKFLGLF